MTTHAAPKSHPRFPGRLVSVTLTVALGFTAALALTRPWEGGSPTTGNTTTTTDPGVSLAEMTRLETLQHEALTDAVFGPIAQESSAGQSLADALAQHEALTEAVFGSLPTDTVASAAAGLSEYPYLAEFIAKYHPFTDGWVPPPD